MVSSYEFEGDLRLHTVQAHRIEREMCGFVLFSFKATILLGAC